ncbi:hypothetical protein B0H63DRAFT_81124 [Podospora didyma]|uniref:Ankyrin n=1 Tax=Podospora didyma TaxID=330526 RepID=A0AAE0K2D3_9PEZI|nr:hypothetical protein B0H63DRAFT_81124 [Podospora didyma]
MKVRWEEGLCHYRHPDGNTTTSSWCDTIPDETRREAVWHDSMLALTIRFGLIFYPLAKLSRSPSVLTKPGRPLLQYVLNDVQGKKRWSTRTNPEMLSVLLCHGADPNETFEGFSVWQTALQAFVIHVQFSIFDLERRCSVLRLLVQHGANPNAQVQLDGPDTTRYSSPVFLARFLDHEQCGRCISRGKTRDDQARKAKFKAEGKD